MSDGYCKYFHAHDDDQPCDMCAKDLEIECLKARVRELESRETKHYDCRIVGEIAEFSGSHCPFDEPCQRCELERAERRIGELEDDLLRSNGSDVNSRLVRMNDEWNDMRKQRDHYREALEDIIKHQDTIAGPGMTAHSTVCTIAKNALKGRTTNPSWEE